MAMRSLTSPRMAALGAQGPRRIEAPRREDEALRPDLLSAGSKALLEDLRLYQDDDGAKKRKKRKKERRGNEEGTKHERRCMMEGEGCVCLYICA